MLRAAIITVGGFLLFIVIYFLGNTTKSFKVKEDFKRARLSGTILDLEDLGHSRYTITVMDYEADSVLKYNLYIGKFIQDNDIQNGDSICKKGNDSRAYFYKRYNKNYSSAILLDHK